MEDLPGASEFVQMNITRILPVLFFLLLGSAQADVYFFNTTDERLTYEVSLPNGDTKTGEIKEDRGYGPTQASFKNSKGDKTPFKVMGEDGSVLLQDTGAYARTFIIFKSAQGVKVQRASWYLSNGQSHKRMMTLFNATGKAVDFALIDEKEMRQISLQPGESKTVSAKNGFGGSSGFHHLKFATHRLDKAASAGYFVILHNDKRDAGEVQAENSGHITAPKGITD